MYLIFYPIQSQYHRSRAIFAMAGEASAFLPAAASVADVEQFRSEVEGLEAEQNEETWRCVGRPVGWVGFHIYDFM